MTVQAEADRLMEAILAQPGTLNDRLGLMVLTATTFVGASATLLERISKEKGGPELDLTGWAEEVMKLITRECKKQLRH